MSCEPERLNGADGGEGVMLGTSAVGLRAGVATGVEAPDVGVPEAGTSPGVVGLARVTSRVGAATAGFASVGAATAGFAAEATAGFAAEATAGFAGEATAGFARVGAAGFAGAATVGFAAEVGVAAATEAGAAASVSDSS